VAKRKSLPLLLSDGPIMLGIRSPATDGVLMARTTVRARGVSRIATMGVAPIREVSPAERSLEFIEQALQSAVPNWIRRHAPVVPR